MSKINLYYIKLATTFVAIMACVGIIGFTDFGTWSSPIGGGVAIFTCVILIALGSHASKEFLKWSGIFLSKILIEKSFAIELPCSASFEVHFNKSNNCRLIIYINNAGIEYLGGKIEFYDIAGNFLCDIVSLDEPKPYMSWQNIERKNQRWPKSTGTTKSPIVIGLPDAIVNSNYGCIKCVLEWNFLGTSLERFVPSNHIADVILLVVREHKPSL